MIQSGGMSINPLAWIGKSKEEFFAEMRGKVEHDKEWLWEKVMEANQGETFKLPKELGEQLGLREVTNDTTIKNREQHKKFKRKRSNTGT